MNDSLLMGKTALSQQFVASNLAEHQYSTVLAVGPGNALAESLSDHALERVQAQAHVH